MSRGMHAQRCPVAKMLAESQKNGNLGRQGTNQYPQKQCHGIKSILADNDKTLLPNQHQTSQKKGKKSLFKSLQKEERWVRTGKGNANQREPLPQTKEFNENRSIHGSLATQGHRPLATQGHRQLIIPKGINYPLPRYMDSRQTPNAERLSNWRRSSLNIALNPHHSLGNAVSAQELESSSYPQSNHFCASKQTSLNSFSSHAAPSNRTISKTSPREEFQCQRTQLTRTPSFFTARCVEPPTVDNKLSQKIMSLQNLSANKPVVSGLLAECTNRNMGMSF